MLGNTDMQKEVMKWVLDHIEYYCPMDEDAEEIMADFASNMYLEEWERASGKCIEIFHMLGDNFLAHIYGQTDGRKIFSRHLDAHTLKSLDSGMECPIGYLKNEGSGRELNSEIRKRRNKVTGLDKDMNFDKRMKTENRWVRIGIGAVIVGIFLLGMFVSWEQTEWQILYALTILIFGGYFIWRVKAARIIVLKRMDNYYRGTVVDKVDAIASWDAMEREGISWNRVLVGDIFSKVKGDEKKVNFRAALVEVKDSCREILQKLCSPVSVFFAVVGMSLMLWLRPIGITSVYMKDKILAFRGQNFKPITIQDKEEKAIIVKVEKEKTEEDRGGKSEDLFAKEGVIFKDSNERELHMEEIEALKQRADMSYKEALAYARNEIYARMGYAFNKEGGKYTEHYSQYEWYRNIEKRKITEDMFNRYERVNIDLILKAEDELEKQK